METLATVGVSKIQTISAMSARFINPLQVLNVKGVVSPKGAAPAPLRLTNVGSTDAEVLFNEAPGVYAYVNINSQGWNPWESGTGMTIQPGEYIEVRSKIRYGYPGIFSISGSDVAASGSAMSMIYGEELNAENNLVMRGSLNSLFDSCDRLVSAPDLPATELTADCYSGIFGGCAALTQVSVGFTEWGGYTADWMRDVAPTGVFRCPAELDTSIRDDSHIPAGWNIETY